MTIPPKVIELAVSGGWLSGGTFDYHKIKGIFFGKPIPSTEWCWISFEEIVLDPTFWKCLGKSVWLDKNPELNFQPIWIESNRNGNTITHLDDWENAAHTLYDLILTQQPIDTFWEEILAAKK